MAAARLFRKLLGFCLLFVSLGIRATVLLPITVLPEGPVRAVLLGLALTVGHMTLHSVVLMPHRHAIGHDGDNSVLTKTVFAFTFTDS